MMKKARKAEEDPKKIADQMIAAIEAEFASLPAEARAALEQAAVSGINDAWLQIEITDSGLIGRPNTIAAEYASKHALEKWFPDITEPTRTRIRQIIKNAFANKTPFAELITEIQDAGIFSGEHPRLMLTDLRKPECPYCQSALKKIPGAKTKCSQCGQFMFVRTRPADRARVVVTEAEAHRIEEGWRIKMIEGAREPDDLAAMIARTEISQAQVQANLDAWKKSGIVQKITWRSVGPDPCPACKSNDGEVRNIGEKFPSGSSMPLEHPNCFCILSAVIDSTSPIRLQPNVSSAHAQSPSKWYLPQTWLTWLRSRLR